MTRTRTLVLAFAIALTMEWLAQGGEMPIVYVSMSKIETLETN